MVFIKKNKLYFLSFVLYLFVVLAIFILLIPRSSITEILNKESAFGKEKLGSLCQYHVEGEPVESGPEYVKLRLSCRDGLISQNTFSKLALKESTLGSLIETYKKMFGFNLTDFEDKFDCRVNSSAAFVDFSYNLMAKDEVYCVEK